MSAKDEIDSLTSWWREAGVDTIVADEPRSWLEAETGKAKPRPAAPTAGTSAAAEMPGDLEAFRNWWRDHDFAGLPRSDRLEPSGDPASGLMVLLDMPEAADAREGRLASGDVGLLLDRMLAAIGRDRASIYLASLSPAAMPGGSIADEAIAALAAAARRHIALAAPALLLLMGEATSRALCASNLAEARGELRTVNHDGGNVSAVATFHPRFLLRQPGLKSESWKDLQLLLERLDA